jgi:hypothetical protein
MPVAHETRIQNAINAFEPLEPPSGGARAGAPDLPFGTAAAAA